MALEILLNDVKDLREKLEAGHIVEWAEGAAHVVCQKRGAEYVTVIGKSEANARANWKKAHQKGYYFDERTKRRVTIPGAR